ncbi:Zinc finger and BTB domain-containing protein 6 [Liparis tanakae]|uniref:Zinc finger and BTB domain-containing protein 6 n=1 Tax=Liparis tanakae TaxID=230148 RepID=A0A4Z2HHQ4_9TELE|nr:Zinc finger and BTB domain-containing protein 6 [Liparis tanakae]
MLQYTGAMPENVLTHANCLFSSCEMLLLLLIGVVLVVLVGAVLLGGAGRLQTFSLSLAGGLGFFRVGGGSVATAVMSSSSDPLRFGFPTHGDSILCKINALREQQRFCDVTLLLGGPQGAAVQPLHFHGHRAVLAASSDFLCDQFLLHEGRAKLSVGVFSRVEVGKRLLLSCYTGLLEVPLRDLVSYLTAASALQMSPVVERCSQAISQYFGPTLAFLKPERHLEEKDTQQPYGKQPGTSVTNQEERDASQPSTGIQESSTEEEGAVFIQSTSRFSQGATIKDNKRGLVIAKQNSEDPACCLESLKSEEEGDMQPVNTNQPPYQVHPVVGAPQCKLHSPPAFQDHTSPRGSPAQCETLVDSSQNQEEEAEGEPSEKEELFLLETQECGKLMDSHRLCLSGAHVPNRHCSGGELQAEGSDTTWIQRPYLCTRCDRVFQHRESYVGHLQQHRRYLCLVCGKGFPQRINLARHVHVHTGVRPFRCPLCHKTFSQKATIQDHFNLHTGDKPHTCKQCAVLFQHKQGLRRHLEDIHGKSSLQSTLEEAAH